MKEIIQGINKILDQLEEIKQERVAAQQSKLKQLQDEWIDSQDVLQLLKICPRKLQDLRRKKVLPYTRIQGKLYYKLSDIEKLLKQNYMS